MTEADPRAPALLTDDLYQAHDDGREQEIDGQGDLAGPQAGVSHS